MQYFHYLLPMACMLTTSESALAEVYKWTDAQGQVHYSQTPPANQDAGVVRGKNKDSLNASSSQLFEAIRNNNSQQLRRLLDNGIHPDSRNNAMQTPLIYAASINQPEMIRLLIRHGASVNTTQQGQSAGRGLPCAPAALGRLANEHAVLRCQDGAHYHSADLLDWQTGAVTDTAWSQPATPAAGLMAQAQRQARHSTLDLERTLLDLHSGRLFGSFGVIVYDLAAILMLLLAITGVWHWARRKRK